MKSLMKLLLLTVVTTTSLMAAQVKLVHITNDEDKSFYHLGVNVDEEIGEVTSVYKKEFSDKGEIIGTDTYSLEQVMRGVVLVTRSDRDVVRITVSNLNPSDGGDIEIDTLYSGVNDSRKRYSASVERVGEDWLFNFENKRAKTLHFISNKVFLIGVVGIKDIKRK
ncbi:hypothetical protein ABMA75_01945 [Halobacteriovorax sp. ZH4_bin.1]|uniref:hypothetical protein n=1 Tax=unclassified Halobacteriovorax TaxID=2639665 RepID=UPI0037190675